MSFTLLSGIRVVEVAILSPDALGGHLADLGADVVKIEAAPAGDRIRHITPTALGSPRGVSLMHLRLNRGKRSVALDLRSANGRNTFLKLVERADVLIEGLRPGTLSGWGLPFSDLHAANPALVICALSGFGADGPYRTLATHGLAYDAWAGWSEPTYPGDEDDPRVPTNSFSIGIIAGPLQAAVGVLAAVLQAQRTGHGAVVEVAQADAAALWDVEELDRSMNREVVHTRAGYRTANGRISLLESVRYTYYATADHRVVLFQATERKFWQRFCDASGRPDLFERFPGEAYDHASGNEELRAQLRELFATRTQTEWIDLFIAADVPGAPVNTRHELGEDRQFLARGNVVALNYPQLGEIRVSGTPIKVAGQRFEARPAPEFGEHTDTVLAEVLAEPPRRAGVRGSRRSGEPVLPSGG